MVGESPLSCSVLIVDDDDSFRKILRETLIDAGISAEEADSAETAIAVVQKKRYDIILLDVKMPGMDGIEALKILRRDHPSTDIMMLTGVHDLTVAIEAVKLGAKEFLTKPIETDALLKHIRMSLRARTAEEKIRTLETELSSKLLYELRTPIAIAKSGVNMLLKGMAGPLSDQQFEVLSAMATNVDKMLIIISDMIDLSKLESGTVNLHRVKTDLAVYLGRFTAMFEPRARAKSITFLLEIEPQIPSAEIDPEKMDQVILNLLDNAVKYTNEGGTIGVRARTKESDGKKLVAIEIHDTGAGIGADEIPFVFDKYKEFVTGKTSEKKSSGLGLAICRKIVEAHNGVITVRSEPGKGSVFAILLPV